ncbi:hypothetical protein LWI29_009066 [Acer saccharum]|uniref:Retrotransposon gag domain-containing protein n=1 Tax=Acer saccharum TaxID=4024 RepID=A0AA39VX80_ACESA|nr:hypothetical protein LWI29_009066 [Acer saccharum]
MNNDSDKDGLSLPIGLGVSSPYELTTPGIQSPGRLRSKVHIATPDAQARQSTEETPQDHPKDFEGRKQRKGKGVMNEESREERDQIRTHGVNSSDTYQRNWRRHRSISSEDKSPRPRREFRSKRARRRRFESTEDRRSPDDRGNYRRMTIKSRLDPAGEPTGQRDVTLQELSRKVSTMARRWFGRLPPGSISSFSNLSKAFIRQFMGSVQRRKSLAHLSNLKQERNESIKKYLARFGKEVAQIEDASDVAVIAAFTNGLQSGRLSFDLRRDRPKTYEEMMEIAGDYALAEEEEVAQQEHKGLAKYPRQQSANARRDTTKYCLFHKYHGHETSKCFQLRDHIESLIRDGHLKDFALKEDKHGDRQDSRRGNGQDRKSPRRNSPNATINTIFGGPHTGRSNRERMSEVREVMYESRSMEINSVQRNPKKGRERHDPITFMAEDSDRIDAKPNDAIVVGVRIAHRDVLRVMIDNRSSADILSARVYDELRLDRKDLEPFHVPLKGFEGAEVRSLGTVKLPVRFGTAPCR